MAPGHLEKGLEIPGLEENSAAVIAAMESVVDQVVSDRAGLSSHEGQPTCLGGEWQANRELTPIILFRIR